MSFAQLMSKGSDKIEKLILKTQAHLASYALY